MSSRLLDAVLNRRSVEDPAKPLTDASLLEALGGSVSASGVSVTPETAMRLTAVYRAVAILAGVMGALPLQGFVKRGNARESVDASILREPHPDSTAFEVQEFVGVSLLTWGNFYAYKARDGLGRVRELWPYHPSRVTPAAKREWRTDANPSGKRFTIREGSSGSKELTPFDVLHIPGLSYNGIEGMSPIAVARQSLGTSMAAEEYGARAFRDGALLQGILSTDKDLKDDQVARTRALWRQQYAGLRNAHDIAVLTGGAKFTQLMLSPADMQFIETRKFGVTDIARLFGLPPHLLADVERSTSWGSGIEQQNMAWQTFTLDQFLGRTEQRYSREVMATGEYAKFNRRALLRADSQARSLFYQRMLQIGVLSQDEVRELEDLNPLPSGIGDQFWMPMNFKHIGAPGAEQEGAP